MRGPGNPLFFNYYYYCCLYINSSTLPQLTCLLHEAKKGESTYILISWAECHVEENGAMCSPCSSSGVLIRGALSLSPEHVLALEGDGLTR
jgi:hypothetical protein